MGSWKSVSGRRRKELYQPYANPRQQFEEEPVPMGGRSFERGYGEGIPLMVARQMRGGGYTRDASLMGAGPAMAGSLMGNYPSEERFYERRTQQTQPSDFNRFYNDVPNAPGASNRIFDRLGTNYNQLGDRRDAYDRRDPYERRDPYDRRPADPYRLSRDDYEYDMIPPRRTGLDMFRRDNRGPRY